MRNLQWSESEEGSGRPEPQRDGVLLDRVVGGDRQALAELVTRHHATVYALALGILADPVEAGQIVDETFRALEREAPHFSPNHYPVSRWLADLTRVAAAQRLLSRPTARTAADQ